MPHREDDDNLNWLNVTLLAIVIAIALGWLAFNMIEHWKHPAVILKPPSADNIESPLHQPEGWQEPPPYSVIPKPDAPVSTESAEQVSPARTRPRSPPHRHHWVKRHPGEPCLVSGKRDGKDVVVRMPCHDVH